MKVLTIIRGASGSGKSTVAAALFEEFSVDNKPSWYEADMFHYENGEYNWKPEKVEAAHDWCKASVEQEMEVGTRNIIVSNTFTRKWEYKPYVDLAHKYGYKIQIIVVQGSFDNVHNVPNQIVKRQKERFEHE